MKKKSIKYLIGFTVLALTIIFILRLNENRTYKLRGNKVVEKIESFRKTEGRLPVSFTEVSLTSEMGEGPYYKKESDSTYIVYFNIGFDNSFVYSSRSGKWEEKP